MSGKVAVIVNDHGCTDNLFDSGLVEIYEGQEGQWKMLQSLKVVLDMRQGAHGVREALGDLVKELGDCKNILGKDISGIPYKVLNAAGMNIFEAEGRPEEYFDSILKSASQIIEEDMEEVPAPKETEISGNYYVNLKELQVTHPMMSSKQILLPFLKEEVFHELEVICSHIPPWFDAQFEQLGLGWDVLMIDNHEYKVTVYRKKCGSC